VDVGQHPASRTSLRRQESQGGLPFASFAKGLPAVVGGRVAGGRRFSSIRSIFEMLRTRCDFQGRGFGTGGLDEMT
jgi:hypothetical protein